MTDPQYPYGQQPYSQQPYQQNPPAQQQQQTYPDYQQPGYQQGYAPAGYQAFGADPAAPYGRDPLTGEPLSDKSKMVAGLLQIFLGQFGVGRFYLGDNKTAGIQLGLTLLGYLLAIVVIGVFVVLGVAIWALVDGIMILTGKVRDPQGRPLKQ